MGRNLGEWSEDESALGETRMGKFEAIGFKLQAAIDNQIKINFAWAVSLAGLSPDLGFEVLKPAEQRKRADLAFEEQGGVEEWGLILQIHRCRFVMRTRHDRAKLAQSSDGGVEITFAVPQIRSKRDDGQRHRHFLPGEGPMGPCRPAKIKAWLGNG